MSPKYDASVPGSRLVLITYPVYLFVLAAAACQNIYLLNK